MRGPGFTFIFSGEPAEESVAKGHYGGHAGSDVRKANFDAAPNDRVKYSIWILRDFML